MIGRISVLATVFVSAVSTAAWAQAKSGDKPTKESIVQPQGESGPINTKSGGAPASSPQGETPPGMQSAPKGSGATIRTDRSGIPEGTPKN